VKEPDAGATGYFLAIAKHLFVKFGYPAFAKIMVLQEP
jgi:hypothetical protein